MTELSFLVEFILLIHSLNQCFDCTVYLLFQWKQSSWNRHTCTCESHTCKIKCRTWTCRGFYLLLLYRQYIHLFRNWSHSCLELLTVSLTKVLRKQNDTVCDATTKHHCFHSADFDWSWADAARSLHFSMALEGKINRHNKLWLTLQKLSCCFIQIPV